MRINGPNEWIHPRPAHSLTTPSLSVHDTFRGDRVPDPQHAAQPVQEDLQDLQAGPDAGADTGIGAVGLRICNLDSRLQQWVWWNRRVLKNLGSDRCLAGGRGASQVWTARCHLDGGEEAAAEDLLWDCEGGRLISMSSSLELSVDDSLSPALSLKSKRSGKWRSLDEGDICQESLSK